MSAESALIVAQQQLIEKLLIANEENRVWQEYCQDVLPVACISDCKTKLWVNDRKHNKTFFGLDFRGRIGDALCNIPALYSMPMTISRIVVSISKDSFHLHILHGLHIIDIVEQPGSLDVEANGDGIIATLEYPQPYDLGFRGQVMAWISEIRARRHYCEIVIQ